MNCISPIPAKRAFTLIELIMVIAIIAILTGLLMPALAKGKSKAKSIACVSQLRQLGAAVRMYTDDNQNVLPAAELLPSYPLSTNQSLPRICDVLSPYVGGVAGRTNSPAVFKCPSDNVGRYASEGSSYEWNTDLNGRQMDETRSSRLIIVRKMRDQEEPEVHQEELAFPPGTTPLLLDYEDFHPRPPKSGKNVVFMDGHVTPLDPDDLE